VSWARRCALETGNKPTEINEMNEHAFLLSPQESLISRCMTSFISGDDYYMSEKETIDSILEDIKKVDPLFVCKLAIYARNKGNMRSVSHLLAAAMAKAISGEEYAKRFYEKIVVRPDDMSEILSAYASLNGIDLKDIKKIPNSIKKGFKKNLENLDAYQIDKYKMKRRNISLVDLVRLFHPQPTQKNTEAYKRLIEGKSLADLYESKVLEKEMTKAGQKTINASEEDKMKAKEEAIASVLDNVKGMPIMNLIRNLRNILLITPNKVDDACEQLRIRDKIINSRLLPFRFATAYTEIERLEYTEKNEVKTEILFEKDIKSNKISREEFYILKDKILNALEDAINIAVEANIPQIGEEGSATAILCDNSGSMRGDYHNTSKVSLFSKTTTADIGNLFGAMVAKRQENVYVGLFGDKLINAPINRKKGILEYAKEIDELGKTCGYSTEQGIYDFMRQVIKEKKRVDNVVVFSDCQIGSRNAYDRFTPWYGISNSERSSTFQELFKEFRKINPMCHWVVVNLKQVKNNSVFDPKSRITNIAGWSEKIFDIINSNSIGWKSMIDEINKIE
ncbi:MAG: TROVE domain-containing protein, partial [Bacilli bacterium]|nr:TROVE domain-containing protein [Bacilli bacterium]